MISWTENFGRFYTFDCSNEPEKEIYINYTPETTGEEMVNMAIALAKQYNCKITGRVEYRPNREKGKISFKVECHSLTYHYFYDGGKTYNLHPTKVTEHDLQEYEKKFGKRKCHQESYKKYWFTDNWNGHIHEFETLRKAKTAAKKQTGNTCCIYETMPYGRGSRFVCYAPASGFTPP